MVPPSLSRVSVPGSTVAAYVWWLPELSTLLPVSSVVVASVCRVGLSCAGTFAGGAKRAVPLAPDGDAADFLFAEGLFREGVFSAFGPSAPL